MTIETKVQGVEKKDKPIRALLDVMGGQRSELGELIDEIPPRLFGKGKARLLRKLVLLAIAASTDADGKNGYPSLETIAHRCLVTHQAVSKTILFLRKKKLLKVESKGHKSSKHGNTNLYEILWPEKKAKKQKATKHLQMEVAGVSEAPATTEGSTCNNSQEHLQQFEEGPANGSCDNRPLGPPSLPSIREKERENPNASSISLSDSKARAAAVVAHGEEKICPENGQHELAKQYFIWLVQKFDLILNAKEKAAIGTAILSGSCDAKSLKDATARTLDGLDPKNSFDRAGEKLATNLPAVLEANRWEAEQRRKDEVDTARLIAEIQAQAALEREADERVRAEEEAGMEDTLRLVAGQAS
jgi:hypothetical protein